MDFLTVSCNNDLYAYGMTFGAVLADKCAEHLLFVRNRPIPDACVPKTILGNVYPQDFFMRPHTSEKPPVSCTEFNSILTWLCLIGTGTTMACSLTFAKV